MFEFAPKRIVLWPVDLPQRTDDGSEAPDKRLLIRYKLLTRSELAARNVDIARTAASNLRSITDMAEAERIILGAEERAATYADMLRERLLGWRDPASGQTGDFSDEDRAALIEDAPTFRALLDGLIDASENAKAKNSSPGPASPPAEAQTNASAAGAQA